MMLISKGVVYRPTYNKGNKGLFLARGGQRYCLKGLEAEVWLRGRFDFAQTDSELEEKALKYLIQKGLAEADNEADALHKYRILTQCVFLPAKHGLGSARLNSMERKLYQWISKAGIHLSLAELVFLIEHGIETERTLLHEENRQNLILTIYTKDNIADNMLECQMERAACRDEVVSATVQLVRKKKILIV